MDGAQGFGRPVVRAADSARATWAMGSLFEHLLEPGEGDGSVGAALVTQPPGIATPLHRHTREAEVFYVLEGHLTYRAGDDVHELTDGSFIFLPAGVPHAFRVRGERPARLLALTTPNGLLGLYDEVGVPAAEHRLPGADGQPPEVELPKWGLVGPRYGLEVVGPGVPE